MLEQSRHTTIFCTYCPLIWHNLNGKDPHHINYFDSNCQASKQFKTKGFINITWNLRIFVKGPSYSVPNQVTGDIIARTGNCLLNGPADIKDVSTGSAFLY